MTNNQLAIEREVNATAAKNREIALQNIPQGWERVIEGDSQKGDMTWNSEEGLFKRVEEKGLHNTNAKYFVCLIREVK